MSHIERGDGFHIVLPSNVKSSGKANTPSLYSTQLVNSINLETPGDQWEVGLVEISFVNAIKTIDKKENIHVFKMPDENLKTVKFDPSTIYNNVVGRKENAQCIIMKGKDGLSQFIRHLDFHLGWSVDEGKFLLSLGSDIKEIRLSPYTAHVLGFSNIGNVATNDKFYTVKEGEKPIIIKYNDGRTTIASAVRGIPLTDTADRTKPFKAIEYLLYLNPLNTEPIMPFEFTLVYNMRPDVEPTSLVIPDGYYQTPQRLVETLNKTLKEVDTYMKFTFDENINRIIFTSNNEVDKWTYYVKLDPILASVLGFQTVVLNKEGMVADYPPDLRRGIYSLYVYCDLCLESHVGNSIVPLLRTVSYNANGIYGQTITVSYDNPIYTPLNKHTIDTIEVKICDDAGRLVPFVEGKTVLILHFRKHIA